MVFLHISLQLPAFLVFPASLYHELYTPNTWNDTHQLFQHTSDTIIITILGNQKMPKLQLGKDLIILLAHSFRSVNSAPFIPFTFVLYPISDMPWVLLSLHLVSQVVHQCPLVTHQSFPFSLLQTRYKQTIQISSLYRAKMLEMTIPDQSWKCMYM